MAPKPKKKKTPLTKEEEDALKVTEAEEAAAKLAAKEKRALQKESIKNPRTKVSSKKVPEAEGGATEEETDIVGEGGGGAAVKKDVRKQSMKDLFSVKPGAYHYNNPPEYAGKHFIPAFSDKDYNVIGEKEAKNITDIMLKKRWKTASRGGASEEVSKKDIKKAGKEAKKKKVDAAKTEIKKTLPQSLNPDKMRHGKRKARYSARLQSRANTKAGVGRSISEHIKGWKKSLKN